jgi:hypothetical protein
MKNNLYLVQKTVRLTCNWVPTGDAKRPLECVWVESETLKSVSAVPSEQETEGLYLCA